MHSWYHTPRVWSPYCVVPKIPEFTVALPCGRVNVEDIDKLFNHTCPSPFAMPKIRAGTFVRAGESCKSVPEFVDATNRLVMSKYRTITRSVGYSIHVICVTLWLIGLPWNKVANSLCRLTAVEIDREWKLFALNACRYALKIPLDGGGILECIFRRFGKYRESLKMYYLNVLHRSRRSLSPAPPSDPFNDLESFITPIDRTKIRNHGFSSKAYIAVGNSMFLSRKVSYENTVVRPLQSFKSTCFMKACDGGYNVAVGVITNMYHAPMYVPLQGNLVSHICDLCPKMEEMYYDPFLGRPHAEDLFCDSVHQNNEWTNCFNTSLLLLLSINRPPAAFATQLNERSMKNRTPNIPEAYAQTVASGISTFGFDTLNRLFPIEFRKVGEPRMRVNGWYKSGDYKDSTSFILFQAGRTAWDLILDHSGLDISTITVFKEALKILIGPHRIFTDNSLRNEIKRIIYPMSRHCKPPGNPAAKRHHECAKMTSINNSTRTSVPQIVVREKLGSVCGTETTPREYFSLDFNDFKSRLEDVAPMLCSVKTILTLRGILMSYRIAAPALMVLNAIPHWEMAALRRSHTFFCSGDDNASSAKHLSDIVELEHRKSSSGMVVHTSHKAWESKHGFVLTEDMYRELPGHKFLVKVPSFTTRVLFPEKIGKLDAITIPMEVFSHVKNMESLQFLSRIYSFLIARYGWFYRKLRPFGISVDGPNSIFKWMKWDGLPYHNHTVKGLYIDSSSSDGIDVACVEQFMTAKKSFSSDFVETSDPYISCRMDERGVSATLSSHPPISVYQRQGPFKRCWRGRGVDVLVKNLNQFLGMSPDRTHSSHWPPPLKGEGTAYVQESVPVPAKNRFEKLHKNVVSNHAYWHGSLTFQSDVRSLSKGIFPTSEPEDPIDFENLSRRQHIFVVDGRNQLGADFQERYPEVGRPERHSVMAIDIITRMRRQKWFKRNRANYHVVLEQPGISRLIQINISSNLVISRPRRGNLGADSEIRALIDIYRKLGKRVKLRSNDGEIKRYYNLAFYRYRGNEK